MIKSLVHRAAHLLGVNLCRQASRWCGSELVMYAECLGCGRPGVGMIRRMGRGCWTALTDKELTAKLEQSEKPDPD